MRALSVMSWGDCPFQIFRMICLFLHTLLHMFESGQAVNTAHSMLTLRYLCKALLHLGCPLPNLGVTTGVFYSCCMLSQRTS
jgi:hypothetical protein